jgi:hypothetical protein
MAKYLTTLVNDRSSGYRDICYELEFEQVVQAWSAKTEISNDTR